MTREWMQPLRYIAAVLAGILSLGLFAGDRSAARGGGAPINSIDGAARVLVFSKTAGYRHASIAAATAAIKDLGASNGFEVDATENAEAFASANLAQYSAVIFLMTTGDVLNDEQQTAFEAYIRAGHGYVGIHSASDTEYGWAWYGRLVGAWFANHPAQQTARVVVEDRQHPSTVGLPPSWYRRDEWYNFRSNPRGKVRVLLALDEGSYAPGNGAMGDHPIAWCQEIDGGRSWYTAGGHSATTYADANFLNHLLGGITWAAGLAPGDCQPPTPISRQWLPIEQR